MKPLATKDKNALKKSVQQLIVALMASATLMLAPSAMAANRDAAGFPPETGATQGDRTAVSREADQNSDLRDATEDAGDRISAAWVRGKIEGAYLFNSELNPLDISVDVQNNTVTLSGEVDSETHKDLAQEIALSIDGVEQINNELTVNPEVAQKNSDNYASKPDAEDKNNRGIRETISDGAVTAHVKAKLMANTNVSGTDVEVSTEAGKVTLSGNVETSEEKELAQYIVDNTAGVRDVSNNLQVRAQ